MDWHAFLPIWDTAVVLGVLHCFSLGQIETKKFNLLA